MPRSRLAVALVVPEPLRTEIDGLRRATDGDLDRIPPHVTLVPPVNVRDEDMPEVLAILRDAAAEQPGSLQLTLGPGATFAPVNRVLYLAVGGSPAMVEGLVSLRSALWRGPLRRDDRMRFIPHVTLTFRLPEGDDELALSLFRGYVTPMEVHSVDLLRYEVEGRRWSTVADAPLGPRRVVGRGGWPLELTVSSVADPEAEAFWALIVPTAVGPSRGPTAPEPAGRRVVVAARRDGAVRGLAWGRVDRRGRVAGLGGVVVEPGERRTGIGRHLVAAFADEAAHRGAGRLELALDADLAADDAAATEALLRSLGWSDRRTLSREVDPA